MNLYLQGIKKRKRCKSKLADPYRHHTVLHITAALGKVEIKTMFFKNKKKEKTKKKTAGIIFAAQSGKVISVTQVNDKVFSQKVLGDGVAIKPESGAVVSPVGGEVVTVADTLHAYGIKTDDGLEVLIHIGVNTVDLNGEGFCSRVSEGNRLSAGDPLCDVDLGLLKSRGYDTDIIILVTNLEPGAMTAHCGINATAGRTCVIEYHM